MKLSDSRSLFVALALALAACGSASSGSAATGKGDDASSKPDTATADAAADGTSALDTASTDAAMGDADSADVVLEDAADAAPDVALDVAADTTELLDSASDVEDIGPAPDAGPDLQDGDSADAGPGDASLDSAEVCSGGLPDCPKNATGSPGTPPAWLSGDCLAPVSPDWQEAGLKPTPELGVELGPLESATPWVPYSDGGWAALYHGPQGLVHTELAIRVSGIGAAGAQVTASVMRAAYLGCAVKTSTIPFAVGLTQVPGGNYFSSNMGLLAIWDMGSNSWKYCGQWVELHVAVRVPDGRWGEGKVRVRLWDMAATCPPP